MDSNEMKLLRLQYKLPDMLLSPCFPCYHWFESCIYIVYTCVYPEFPDTSGTSSQNEKNDSVVYQWHSLSHAKYRKRRALPLFTPRITEDLLWTVSDTRDHRKQPGKSPLKLRQYSMTGYCNISNIYYVYLYDTIQYKIIQYNTI